MSPTFLMSALLSEEEQAKTFSRKCPPTDYRCERFFSQTDREVENPSLIFNFTPAPATKGKKNERNWGTRYILAVLSKSNLLGINFNTNCLWSAHEDFGDFIPVADTIVLFEYGAGN